VELPAALLITCEHARNRVPAALRGLFAGDPGVLQTHRSWDPGALELARRLGRRLETPVHAGEVSRLLVDLNRSADSRELFSAYTRVLDGMTRMQLLQRYYLPYRLPVAPGIQRTVDLGFRVVHVSVHTFTPVLGRKVRDVDIGLLYDPARAWEVDLVERWRSALAVLLPGLRIRRNAPYRGTSDGHTRALRGLFPETRYAGIELEVNQRFPLRQPVAWTKIQTALATSLAYAIGG
jgi:predicted N-formylglutamate amidohydrolase